MIYMTHLWLYTKLTELGVTTTMLYAGTCAGDKKVMALDGEFLTVALIAIHYTISWWSGNSEPLISNRRLLRVPDTTLP